MIRIYTALQRYDAFLVADRLNQAGIKAHVFNQHASSIVGEVPPDVAQPQVWIERECDLERAQVVLRDIESAGAGRGRGQVRRVRRTFTRQLRPVLELRGRALAVCGIVARGIDAVEGNLIQ